MSESPLKFGLGLYPNNPNLNRPVRNLKIDLGGEISHESSKFKTKNDSAVRQTNVNFPISPIPETEVCKISSISLDKKISSNLKLIKKISLSSIQTHVSTYSQSSIESYKEPPDTEADVQIKTSILEKLDKLISKNQQFSLVQIFEKLDTILNERALEDEDGNLIDGSMITRTEESLLTLKENVKIKECFESRVQEIYENNPVPCRSNEIGRIEYEKIRQSHDTKIQKLIDNLQDDSFYSEVMQEISALSRRNVWILYLAMELAIGDLKWESEEQVEKTFIQSNTKEQPLRNNKNENNVQSQSEFQNELRNCITERKLRIIEKNYELFKDIHQRLKIICVRCSQGIEQWNALRGKIFDESLYEIGKSGNVGYIKLHTEYLDYLERVNSKDSNGVGEDVKKRLNGLDHDFLTKLYERFILNPEIKTIISLREFEEAQEMLLKSNKDVKEENGKVKIEKNNEKHQHDKKCVKFVDNQKSEYSNPREVETLVGTEVSEEKLSRNDRYEEKERRSQHDNLKRGTQSNKEEFSDESVSSSEWSVVKLVDSELKQRKHKRSQSSIDIDKLPPLPPLSTVLPYIQNPLPKVQELNSALPQDQLDLELDSLETEDSGKDVANHKVPSWILAENELQELMELDKFITNLRRAGIFKEPSECPEGSDERKLAENLAYQRDILFNFVFHESELLRKRAMDGVMLMMCDSDPAFSQYAISLFAEVSSYYLTDGSSELSTLRFAGHVAVLQEEENFTEPDRKRHEEALLNLLQSKMPEDMPGENCRDLWLEAQKDLELLGESFPENKPVNPNLVLNHGFSQKVYEKFLDPVRLVLPHEVCLLRMSESFKELYQERVLEPVLISKRSALSLSIDLREKNDCILDLYDDITNEFVTLYLLNDKMHGYYIEEKLSEGNKQYIRNLGLALGKEVMITELTHTWRDQEIQIRDISRLRNMGLGLIYAHYLAQKENSGQEFHNWLAVNGPRLARAQRLFGLHCLATQAASVRVEHDMEMLADENYKNGFDTADPDIGETESSIASSSSSWWDYLPDNLKEQCLLSQ